MGTPKEHRAPTRYSLLPYESREILDHCESRGHITDRQLTLFANRFGCARKTVYQVVEMHHYSVIPSIPAQDRKREHLQNDESLSKPFEETADQVPHEPTLGAEDENLNVLVMEEEILRETYQRKEAELLEAVSDLEAQFEQRSSQVELHSEKARQAIQQTRRLRISTRQDRDDLETLRGENTLMAHKLRKAQKQTEEIRQANKEIRAQLKESMARERRLIDALSQSENDLQAIKSRLPKR